MTYIKIKAQRLLAQKKFKAFFVSVLPFFMAASLFCLNYYLLNFLKNGERIYLFVKILIVSADAVISILLLASVCFIRENYFYKKATDSFSPVRAVDIFCSVGVSAIKFLLFFSWAFVFFAPGGVLLYCTGLARKNGYANEIIMTLLISSLITLLVGVGCLFVILGRYSKTYFIQMKTGKTNPVKVIADSIEQMEGKMLKLALFRLSFLGWDILSLLIFPIIYVLPYRKCAKYVFFSEKKKLVSTEPLSEKPIVFIFG